MDFRKDVWMIVMHDGAIITDKKGKVNMRLAIGNHFGLAVFVGANSLINPIRNQAQAEYIPQLFVFDSAVRTGRSGKMGGFQKDHAKFLAKFKDFLLYAAAPNPLINQERLREISLVAIGVCISFHFLYFRDCMLFRNVNAFILIYRALNRYTMTVVC